MLNVWGFTIIVVVILLVFGTRRIGSAFRSLGIGGREFKREIRGEDKLPPPAEPEQ